MITLDKVAPEKLNIALADDDADDRFLFKNAIESVNDTVKVMVFEDGKGILEYLEKPIAQMPDVVFLDINMPNMDGFQTAKAIKENINLSQICIIMYSTSDNKNDIIKAYKLGANAYITKPSNINELKCLLNEILHLDWHGECDTETLEKFLKQKTF